MLEGIGAGANSISGARRSVRVNRDLLAEGVRDIDRRLHLLERKRLKLCHVVEAAGRSVHLHPVGTGRDDLSYGAHDAIDSVDHDADRRGGTVLRVIMIAVPETNMRGPIIFPMLMRSRIARSTPSAALRSRIVVTPASSALSAFSCARTATTAG